MFTAEVENEIRERLSELSNRVKIVLFARTPNSEAEALVRPLAGLSNLIDLEVLDPSIDTERAGQYRVSEAPTIIVEGDRDYGIRFLGVPLGYEFACLLEDIVSVGKRQSGLSEDSIRQIQSLAEPIHLRVFVTPT